MTEQAERVDLRELFDRATADRLKHERGRTLAEALAGPPRQEHDADEEALDALANLVADRVVERVVQQLRAAGA